MNYEICIRCRIFWVSMAVTLLHVTLFATCSFHCHWTNAEVVIDDKFTIDKLPLDGHLNSQSSTLPTNVDCTCRQHQRTHHDSKQPSTSGVRIFYLIILHNVHTIRDALHLFRAVRDPRHTVVFHLDQKAQNAIDAGYQNSTLLQEALGSLRDEILSCPCGSRVELQSVHSVQWSKWSMNLPTLWGMELATSDLYKDKWDVFINLSGDTLPVYTPSTMARILKALPYNFVTSRSCETGLIPTNVYDFPKSWHKRKHYTDGDKHPPPTIEYNDTWGNPQSTRIDYYFGSQWVVLQKDFVHYVATELTRNDSFVSRYRDHLVKTRKMMTDETFLPTIIMHVTPFNETLPVGREGEDSALYIGDDSDGLPAIYSIRYERMDEHVPSPLRGYYPSHPRYQVPMTPVHGVLLPPEPHTWGPYYLGTYDLADIAESGALFLRKTSSAIDPNLYHLLPVDDPGDIPRIRWPPAGIQASAVPDWPREKLAMMKRALKKANEEGEAGVSEKIQHEVERLEKAIAARDGARQVPGEEGGDPSMANREPEAVDETGHQEET